MTNFNPRSPYGERQAESQGQKQSHRFQSTLPLRGATLIYVCTYYEFRYFNPRSPYGERPVGFLFLGGCIDFNPRSPYGERP